MPRQEPREHTVMNVDVSSTRPADAGAIHRVRGFTPNVEVCPDTGLLVGYVPGLPGAHSQGINWAELRAHLEEVIDRLRDGADPVQVAPQAHALELSERPEGRQVSKPPQ